MPDPKLQELAAEIKALFIKYDVMGYAAFAAREHGEYLHRIDPSWAGITQEGPHVRVKVQKKDFDTKEEFEKCCQHTFGALHMMISLSKNALNGYSQIVAAAVRTGAIEIEGDDYHETVNPQN